MTTTDGASLLLSALVTDQTMLAGAAVKDFGQLRGVPCKLPDEPAGNLRRLLRLSSSPTCIETIAALIMGLCDVAWWRAMQSEFGPRPPMCKIVADLSRPRIVVAINGAALEFSDPSLFLDFDKFDETSAATKMQMRALASQLDRERAQIALYASAFRTTRQVWLRELIKFARFWAPIDFAEEFGVVMLDSLRASGEAKTQKPEAKEPKAKQLKRRKKS